MGREVIGEVQIKGMGNEYVRKKGYKIKVQNGYWNGRTGLTEQF
jgi:hypothetical protein